MMAYYDLGQYTRPVTTKSADAQVWFDRGLVWCYGYNHEESVQWNKFGRGLFQGPSGFVRNGRG